MAHGYLGDGYGSHGDIDPDRDDDRERGQRGDWRGRHERWREEDRDRGGMFGGWGRSSSSDERATDWRSEPSRDQEWSQDLRSGQRFSAHQDDHYRSWRDRHMSELDRDYADYCREREQQFHRDFDSWRSNRGPRGRLVTDQAGELELTHERPLAEEGNTPSPVGEATLGTNNSENTITGRGTRQR